MKNLTALTLASILGLVLIPAAQAQEYGSIPNSYRGDVTSAPAQTSNAVANRPRFQALATSPRHASTVNRNVGVGLGSIFSQDGAL